MEQLRLSPSRMNDFTNCPQLYKYRAIDLLPEPPSIDAERGKLIHSVLEDIFELPASDRTFESAVDLLPASWSAQLEKTPELGALVLDEKEWMDRAQALLTNYFSLENPTTFESTYRELHLERNISDEVYLHGYVDRLDIAPTGEVRIVDYKTGKSPKPGWEEKALFQLRVYALLYWQNHGVLPRMLKLIYLGDVKTIESQPTEAQLTSTEKKLNNIGSEILTAIETGHFPTRKSRLCDWCFFKAICPAHVK
ncbi:RecB family exonuclease [Candidatus Planktophila versatilis]|jgi:putative RecB family exonuclease|nr:PD-(D/E)XK nuclease family protein [Candidatus Planktophila versatilis]